MNNCDTFYRCIRIGGRTGKIDDICRRGTNWFIDKPSNRWLYTNKNSLFSRICHIIIILPRQIHTVGAILCILMRNKLAIAKAGFFCIAQAIFANGTYTLAQIIEEAQSFDPATLVATVEKMDTVDTIFGTGKVGGSENYGHRRMVYHPFPIWRIEGGKAVFGRWTPADVLYSP